jgi:hypothetical protein
MCVCVCVYIYITMLTLNMFVYKLFYEKKEKKIFKISFLFKCMKQ